jgi:hypothetical protein
MDTRRPHPNWTLADQVLRAVISQAGRWLPDDVIGSDTAVSGPFGIYERDPAVVTEDLLAYCEGVVGGLLIVVTDDSLLSYGPFFVDAEDLPRFARTYPDAMNSVFVGGDLIILSAATGRAVVVHHSEFAFTVRGVARRWHAPKP